MQNEVTPKSDTAITGATSVTQSSDVLRLAEEAGFPICNGEVFGSGILLDEDGSVGPITDELTKFAALIRAQVVKEVAEACAELCVGTAWSNPNTPMLGPEQNALKCAEIIRKHYKLEPPNDAG